MIASRSISVGTVLAAALWFFAVAFVCAGTIVGIAAQSHVGAAIGISVIAHGLLCSAAAATVTIRNGLVEQSRLLEDAFRLGQDAAGVRRMH